MLGEVSQLPSPWAWGPRVLGASRVRERRRRAVEGNAAHALDFWGFPQELFSVTSLSWHMLLP